MRKYNPMRPHGMAAVMTSTVAKSVRPAVRNARLPTTTTPAIQRTRAHSPILKEDTEPSASPTKKKISEYKRSDKIDNPGNPENHAPTPLGLIVRGAHSLS